MLLPTLKDNSQCHLKSERDPHCVDVEGSVVDDVVGGLPGVRGRGGPGQGRLQVHDEQEQVGGRRLLTPRGGKKGGGSSMRGRNNHAGGEVEGEAPPPLHCVK